MDSKPTIADTGNVGVPAYLTLLAKGYRVRCEKQSGTPDETWHAEDDNVRLIASDAVTLLGIATLFESRGTEWKASDQEIDDFIKKFGY